MDTTSGYDRIHTPLGPAWCAFTARGIAVLAVGRAERAFLAEARTVLGERPRRRALPRALAAKVRAGIARGDGTAVDWTMIPSFQRRVLEECARIPPGAVRSYAEIARRIKAPNAQRAVGTALARNPVPFLVPCHRVVRSDGTLGNYGIGGTPAKRRLLVAEGYAC